MQIITRDKAFVPAGVLTPGYHERLFLDLKNFAHRAGLGGAPKYVVQSAKPHLDQEEITRAAKLKEYLADGTYGSLYGPKVPNVPSRFMALTGAFLRNYVNARYMTMAQVLEDFRQDNYVQATILLIPDFHIPMAGEVGPPKKNGEFVKSSGYEKNMTKPQFITEAVAGLLLQRISNGQYTYLYSEDPSRLEKDYGPYITKLISENFEIKSTAGETVA